MAAPRIHRGNLVLNAGAVLVPCSEQPGFTRDALLRPGITDRLRFKTRWDVKAGVNDRIDFNRVGANVATLTAGNYATAAAMAAAIVTALNLADAGQGWAASQDTTTGRWTISATPAFTLLWGTGTNKLRSIATDIGHTEADTASLTSHTGIRAAWQSRKWLTLDAGPALVLNRWIIEEGVNDAIDFDRGGVKVAYVAAGTYDSGQALAAAVVAALEAADPTRDWFAFYPIFGGGFEVRDATSGAANWSLLTLTGANAARAIWVDLGYETTADHTGNTFYWSDEPVTGSPPQRPSMAMLLGHTLSDQATVRLEGHTSDLGSLPLNQPALFTGYLAREPKGATSLRLLQFTIAAPLRYWRLTIDDTLSGSPTDARSYVELGVWGLYLDIDLPGVAPELADRREELSGIAYAVEGAHSVVRRSSRRILQLQVRRLEDAGKEELEALAEEVRVGGVFFFTLDSAQPFTARYVFLEHGLSFQAVESVPRTWLVDMALHEVLG